MDEKQLKKLFGQRVRQIRKSKKLTQEELAERVWMDPQHFCKMENGSHFPSPKNLLKLSAALDCEIKDLFNYAPTEDDEITRKILSELKNLNTKEKEFILKTINAILELR